MIFTYSEEQMLLDLLGIALSSSQTALGIPPQQLKDQLDVAANGAERNSSCHGYPVRVHSTHPPHDGDGLRGEEPRVAYLVVHDAVKHLLFIITGKRRLQGTTHFEVTYSAPIRDGILLRRSFHWPYNGIEFRKNRRYLHFLVNKHANKPHL